MKIIKNLKFLERITNNHENHRIPCENHETDENPLISLENQEIHENH